MYVCIHVPMQGQGKINHEKMSTFYIFAKKIKCTAFIYPFLVHMLCPPLLFFDSRDKERRGR